MDEITFDQVPNHGSFIHVEVNPETKKEKEYILHKKLKGFNTQYGTAYNAIDPKTKDLWEFEDSDKVWVIPSLDISEDE